MPQYKSVPGKTSNRRIPLLHDRVMRLELRGEHLYKNKLKGKKYMFMKRKGIALFLSLIVIAVLTVLSTGAISHSISEARLTRRYSESVEAFWLAEAAVNRALKELRDNPSLLGVQGPYSLGRGQYSFTIQTVSGDPTQRKITVDGAVPSLASVDRVERNLEIMMDQEGNPLFSHAAFGKTLLTMTGNGETDSYDSREGPYGGGEVNQDGDVGSNGTEEGVVTLDGNATVNGDAETGPGGTVVINGEAEVTGDITDESNQDLPPVVVPSSLTSLPDGGTYTVGGNNSVTITEGDYKFSKISVQGNGTLTLEGTVNIYLTDSESLDISSNGALVIADDAVVKIYTDGTVDIAGNGVVNNTQLPQNFILYSTYSGEGDGVKTAGNGVLFGALYAPDAKVKIAGNGDIYGSVVGNEVQITGNGDMHYDEALEDADLSSPRFVVAIWKDLQNPYILTP